MTIHNPSDPELDAALRGWARAPARADTDASVARALAALPSRTRPATRWPWAAGAAIAAGLGAAALWPGATPSTAPPVQLAAPSDATLFPLLFTPTPDEEDLI